MHQKPATVADTDARRLLKEVVLESDFEAAWMAYEEARISGLCHEGAWEIALGTVRERLPAPPRSPSKR